LRRQVLVGLVSDMFFLLPYLISLDLKALCVYFQIGSSLVAADGRVPGFLNSTERWTWETYIRSYEFSSTNT